MQPTIVHVKGFIMGKIIVIAIFIVVIYLLTLHGPVMINRMDFYKRTLFYSKTQIFFAILLLLVCIIAAIASGDLKTSIIIIGGIICIYLLLVIHFFIRKIRRNLLKCKSIKIPAQIVGIKKSRKLTGNSVDNRHFRTSIRLIVTFVHPITNEIVEHISDFVTGHPFYSLKDLNVNVYYQKDGTILIDDFNRIRRNKENLSYQYTGKVSADKIPDGILRVEQDD